jgi:hypothetical protein
MRATVRVTPVLSLDVEGETAKGLFKGIAEAQATFEDSACGACNGTDIRYVVRQVDSNEFYEVHCQNFKCRAKLSYGHNKDGKTMYPKRYEVDNKGKAKKTADGKTVYLPNKGWTIYKPEDK